MEAGMKVKVLGMLAYASFVPGHAVAQTLPSSKAGSSFVGEWTGVRHLIATHYKGEEGVDLRIEEGQGGLEITDLTRVATGTSPVPVTVNGRQMSASWTAMSGKVGLRGEISPDGRTLRVHFLGEIDDRREAGAVTLTQGNAEAKRFFEPSQDAGSAYVAPPEIGDGWRTGSLKDTSANLGMLEDMVHTIKDQNRDPKGNETDGVLIAIGGKLVFEEYFWGYNRTIPHQISSDTKSVTSLLTGIAADRTGISPSDLVFKSFPDYSTTPWVKDKYPITLGQVMSMTAGLDWNENLPYQDPNNTAEGLLTAKDPIAYVLDRKIAETPGTHFNYNSGLPNLVGDAVSRRIGESFGTFADQALFAPLGITDYFWTTQKNGHVLAAGGLYLRPRDMAKIGQLMLDGGIWNGHRIVSDKWITDSTSQKTVPGDYPYGYYWHLSTKEKSRLNGEVGFMAIGQAGQYIVVVPRFKAVIVVTSSDWQPGGTPVVMKQIIDKFIIPALNATS